MSFKGHNSSEWYAVLTDYRIVFIFYNRALDGTRKWILNYDATEVFLRFRTTVKWASNDKRESMALKKNSGGLLKENYSDGLHIVMGWR